MTVQGVLPVWWNCNRAISGRRRWNSVGRLTLSEIRSIESDAFRRLPLPSGHIRPSSTFSLQLTPPQFHAKVRSWLNFRIATGFNPRNITYEGKQKGLWNIFISSVARLLDFWKSDSCGLHRCQVLRRDQAGKEPWSGERCRVVWGILYSLLGKRVVNFANNVC